jgi:predicted transcriptional regulator of viral defense system
VSYYDILTIDKPYFSQNDVAHALGIKLGSAAVLCSRYVKKGLLVRLKRGLYARTERFSHLGQIDLFRIANIMQVPSYISLRTALSYYGISPSDQNAPYESISIKRTKIFESGALSFHYTKIRPDLYRDFINRDGVFIAIPEKALLDCFYLASMGRYAMDGCSLDLNSINEQTLKSISDLYPMKTRKLLEVTYGKISRT